MAATNRDLDAEVAAGRFREDLFYRLNVVPLKRARPARAARRHPAPGTSTSCAHFRDDPGAARYARSPTTGALDKLMAYAWPGNVRELENVIERAMILADGDRITVRELPDNVIRPAQPDDARGDFSLKRARRIVEADLIRRALLSVDGNRTHAARLLGISHRALLYKIKEYGLRD